MFTKNQLFRSYSFPMILLMSIMMGGGVGYYFPEFSKSLKPFGDIFLNLILTTIVPLIFFSVSSAIARASTLGKLGRIFSSMFVIFFFTGMVAASLALIIVLLFPPAQDIHLTMLMPQTLPHDGILAQLAGIFTVTRFSDLLSHRHMLALIIFAILVGVASSSKAHDKAKAFTAVLSAGEHLFTRVFTIIMYYAPIGFLAYFAVLVSELGPSFMESYCRVALIYYLFVISYFVIVYTGFAYLAAQLTGIRLFWKYIPLPMLTAIATCSSAASIPANLVGTQSMRISPEICETAIPLGTILHKEGSVIGGMMKIAFLFGVFHLNFFGAAVWIKALGVSLLVGTVMGAIPSGGMLGELLILSVYGFPSSALMVIAAISIIIDPMATLLNVTGNSVSCLLLARSVDGKKWYANK